MKKLKCKSCSEIWYIDDNKLNSQKVCPFCAVSIRQELKIDKYDTLDKAIYGALMSGGLDILKEPSKLSAYMFDMCPDLKKEIRIFSRTVTSDYAKDVVTAFKTDIQKADDIFLNIKMQMVENDGVSETWAETICNALRCANMFMRGINIPHVLLVDVKDMAMPTQNPLVQQTYNTKSVTKPNNRILGSGKVGIMVKWTMYSDGKLVISGTGAMENYDSTISYPWYRYRNEIVSLVVESGVKNISQKSFANFYKNLKTVRIEEGVRDIGNLAFFNCSKLVECTLPKSLEKIGDYCFAGCTNISQITIPGNVKEIGGWCFNNWTKTQVINFMPKRISDVFSNWNGGCNARIIKK